MDKTRYKIVLVDDNIATLNQGKTLLQELYRVYTVQSPVTLFENLENDIPDLILLDVEMPEMNGFEVIKKLKADIRYRDIPVMFLTAKSDAESEREGFKLGAVDYIIKPFSGPLLQKRVSNQILYKRVQSAVKDYSSSLEKMMEEVRKAEIAEESNKAKSRFLANMSHEMRTPLNVILGLTSLIYEEDSSIPNLQENIMKINTAGNTLLQFIDELLNISKMEAGKLDLEILDRLSCTEEKPSNDKPPDDKPPVRQKLIRPDLSYAKVLVVDDMQANLDVATALLSKYKMQVDCVLSGKEAVERIRGGGTGEQHVYNAIFMDHMMPGMDGIETANAIRSLGTEYARKIPIIALTANAIAGTEEMFYANDFQDFVSKPINIMKLDSAVQKWILK